jgi:hypothetical protein
MKYVLPFPVLGLLLLTSCGSRVERLNKKMVGTWTTDHGSDMWVLASDGSFDQKWSDTTHGLDYKGTWEIKDGILSFTITTKTSTNLELTNMASIGSVTRLNIIGVDNDHLTFEIGGITNQWERKP